MSSLPRRGLLVALSAVAFAATLSACGSSGPAAGTLPTVHGGFGVTPKISFPTSAPSKKLQVKVLDKGTGPVVEEGQLLVANYFGQIWRGKVFGSSFSPPELAGFQLSAGQVIPAWYLGIAGARLGSRLLIVAPPADGYGAQGNSNAGITGTDTLAFVVDLVAAYSQSATGPGDLGAVHATHFGVTVNWPAGGGLAAPSVTIAAGAPKPTKPTVTTLQAGSGPKVTAGLVVLQYVVASYATGKAVESTWQKGAAPQGEPVGSEGASRSSTSSSGCRSEAGSCCGSPSPRAVGPGPSRWRSSRSRRSRGAHRRRSRAESARTSPCGDEVRRHTVPASSIRVVGREAASHAHDLVDDVAETPIEREGALVGRADLEVDLRAAQLAEPVLGARHQLAAESTVAVRRMHREVVEPATVSLVADHHGADEGTAVVDDQHSRWILHELAVEVLARIVPRTGELAEVPQLEECGAILGSERTDRGRHPIRTVRAARRRPRSRRPRRRRTTWVTSTTRPRPSAGRREAPGGARSRRR